jgi:hypothetical protein
VLEGRAFATGSMAGGSGRGAVRSVEEVKNLGHLLLEEPVNNLPSLHGLTATVLSSNDVRSPSPSCC